MCIYHFLSCVLHPLPLVNNLYKWSFFLIFFSNSNWKAVFCKIKHSNWRKYFVRLFFPVFVPWVKQSSCPLVLFWMAATQFKGVGPDSVELNFLWWVCLFTESRSPLPVQRGCYLEVFSTKTGVVYTVQMTPDLWKITNQTTYIRE